MNYAVILASGQGNRFGSDIPKQFVKIGRKMVIEYTLDIFEKSEHIDKIILVAPQIYLEKLQKLKKYFPKIEQIVRGGSTRRESCTNGISVISEQNASVFIHNAVQPLISLDTIQKCAEALKKYDAVSTAIPCVYTVLETHQNRTLKKIHPRKDMFNDFGTECFKLPVLKKALSYPDDDCTDFIGLVFKHHLSPVYLAESNPENIKITHALDLELVKILLKKQKVK